MILSFKKQFVEPIKTGRKIHTIRKDPSRRWKRGKNIHFSTGVRTKKYECFGNGECKSTQTVFMTYAYNDLIEISIDGAELFDYKERLEFAQNDGFDTWEDFFNWFYPIIQADPNKEFSARLIHWTDKRY